MPKKPAVKKNPKDNPLIVKPMILPEVPRGPTCPKCGVPCDVSQRAGDDELKARCINEQCPRYGEVNA